MTSSLFIGSTIVAASLCSLVSARDRDGFAIGADLSFLKQAEAQGAVFKCGGEPKRGLEIFREHGYDWVRLRLFHTPSGLPNDLPYTISLAKEAKGLGFRFLLDFHYSDTWADPGKQALPAAWAGKTHEELVNAVYLYSRDTIMALDRAGVMPDMVQPGNEITGGMLWPDGRLPGNASNFIDLLQAAISGVYAGSPAETRPKIMIHIDRGGDKAGTRVFFDRLIASHVPFDVIGQSYYPWWHGGIDQLTDNLQFMAETYDKDIVVVETAYNWRPAEYLGKPAPWPETPAGQKEFLEAVNRAVLNTPRGRGMGIFWWEPAVGSGSLRSRGFFDDEGNALPVIRVFDRAPRPASPERGRGGARQ
jgi:arabinogalactan endo-1,4-beta-galactosidase